MPRHLAEDALDRDQTHMLLLRSVTLDRAASRVQFPVSFASLSRACSDASVSWQDRAAPQTTAPLGPRHVAALQQLRGGPVSVSELSSRLGLTLPTVSGVLADLDRPGFVSRRPDPADRRRTIVQIAPDQSAVIGQWLDGAASPLARVLDKLGPDEQAAFLKAMDLLETELRPQNLSSPRPQPGVTSGM